MNDKLKAMYAGGGILRALLKDPKQRAMAEKMLAKAANGMAVKSYTNGDPKRDKMILKEIRDEDKAFVNRGMKDFYYTRPGVSPTGYGDPTMDQTIEVTGYNKPGGATREEVEAYVKEQIQAKQRQDMGIDDIPTYGTGGAMKYRIGGNMPGEDEETMLNEVTVVDREPSHTGFKSSLFIAEGVSKDDYMRERSNLGRELADNLVQGGKPVSDKVVRALLGEEVQLSELEAKELGYLRDKGASSMLTDMQLERGLLEQGYIDKKTRQRVSPELMSEAQRRGLGLKTDSPGLSATYRYQ